MHHKRLLIILFGTTLLSTAAPAGALTISYDFDHNDFFWTDAVRLVVKDAVDEWQAIYCPPINVQIHFTVHMFMDNAVAYTAGYEWDPVTKRPVKADIELNKNLYDSYYWDPTPWDITDDAGAIDGLWDAASVLKHELYHALGFARDGPRFVELRKIAGDIDGLKETHRDANGVPHVGYYNEYYLDFNDSGNYEPGEPVLTDQGTAHFDGGTADPRDGFYDDHEALLMGDPGFGPGQQARPSDLEIQTLARMYNYPVRCVPEPATAGLAMLSLAGVGISALRRRQRA